MKLDISKRLSFLIIIIVGATIDITSLVVLEETVGATLGLIILLLFFGE